MAKKYHGFLIFDLNHFKGALKNQALNPQISFKAVAIKMLRLIRSILIDPRL